MKAVMIVLIIFVAACLIFPAATSGSFGQMSGFGPEKPQFWASGSDAKRMEDKMTEALRGLGALKEAKTGLNNSTLRNGSLDNSSFSNSIQLNSTGLNSSAVSSSAAGALFANSSAGLQEVGANSKGSFNGYLGITASRHEMGKSDIKSSTFLSGGFDVDKTVQFSDRGF